jgi:hypothetical protein
MTDKSKPPVAELFDQAMKNYEQALKTGLKMQEEVTKWWSNLYCQPPWSAEWQKKMTAAMEDVFPAAQKNLEEGLRMIEQNSRASLELMRQTMEASQDVSLGDGNLRVQKLWQTSLNAVQTNAQSITNANARLMSTWANIAQKAMEAAPAGKGR